MNFNFIVKKTSVIYRILFDTNKHLINKQFYKCEPQNKCSLPYCTSLLTYIGNRFHYILSYWLDLELELNLELQLECTELDKSKANVVVIVYIVVTSSHSKIKVHVVSR